MNLPAATKAVTDYLNKYIDDNVPFLFQDLARQKLLELAEPVAKVALESQGDQK